jgi:hypothetical protein
MRCRPLGDVVGLPEVSIEHLVGEEVVPVSRAPWAALCPTPSG